MCSHVVGNSDRKDDVEEELTQRHILRTRFAHNQKIQYLKNIPSVNTN